MSSTRLLSRLLRRNWPSKGLTSFNRSLTVVETVVSSAKNGLHISAIRRDEFSEHAKFEADEKEKETRNDDREEEIKCEILDMALEEVHEHGWTRAAVAASATKLGHPSVVSGLITRGGVDLVLHHVNSSNKKLDIWMEQEVRRITADGNKKLPIGKFVRSAIIERLKMNTSFIKSGRWTEALALSASNPQVACESLGCVQQLCDDIWYRAGDTSTDYNWYSKRITLAAVYTSTEVFLLQDNSEDYSDSWQFLDRRFEDLQAMPNMKQLPGDMAGVISGIVTTAKNIAGIQK